MALRLGSGRLIFEPVEGWEKLPEGWSFIDVAGVAVDSGDNVYVFGMPGVDDAPGLGHRVSVYNLRGQLQTRFGDPEEGEGPGQFIAPHGVAVDSRGDLYVGEVAYTIRGRHMNPPRYLRCLRKFRRIR